MQSSRRAVEMTVRKKLPEVFYGGACSLEEPPEGARNLRGMIWRRLATWDALADSRAFFTRIGIDNTSQQIAIIGAIAKACADHPPPKRKCDEHNAAYGENKKRRLQPQNLVPRPTASHTARRYLPDAASQRWDILNPTTEDDNHEEFFLWGAAPGLVGHRRRISKLLRSCFMGRRPQPRGQKYQADKIDRPYDPADCEVLPAYGESSDEYDFETWEEIQQEQNESARACAPDNAPLSEEEVGSILDSCVEAYQADWYHDKLPNLKSLAQLAPSSVQAQRLLHQEHDHLVRIIAQLRRNLFAPRAPWTRVAKLVEAAGPPSPASACDSYRRRPAAPGSARVPTPDGPPSPSSPRPRALPRPDPMRPRRCRDEPGGSPSRAFREPRHLRQGLGEPLPALPDGRQRRGAPAGRVQARALELPAARRLVAAYAVPCAAGPRRQVPGGCLGDEMGLGKSFEVIATFAIFATIKTSYQKVRRAWRRADLTANGQEHLPEDQPATVTVCPSQHLCPYSLLCLCVKSGESYLIATRLPSLPILCFAPPTSLHGCKAEFQKLIDTECGPLQSLRLSVMHASLRHDQDHFHGPDRVAQTMACVRDHKTEDATHHHLTGSCGLSNWFILCSWFGTKELHKSYDTPGGNRFAASFAFFDESHTYRGSLRSPTQLFILLRTMTHLSWEPTVAFAVSASIPAGGPRQLVNIVDHALLVQSEQLDNSARV
ncbi:hypothetical protein JX266_014216 [Neoarthrinium moseri]|nr:hypothetical protein JX266_014216 [Neoarthrinium moseri]